MSEPTSLEDYERRFAANQQIDGYGLEVTSHSPCPFCAAPDWASWPILETEEVMQRESTCRECGRSGRFIFTVNTPDHKQFEFVQTGGADPPAWLQPPPRRIA
jgi:hypothetical protein